MDLEIYSNYFLAAFKEFESRRTKHFEFYPGHPLDTAGIFKILRNYRIVTFNGNNFDVPLLCLSMREGVTNKIIKQASDSIILRGTRPWELRDIFRIPEINWLDHVDLIEVAPGMVSLKIYNGRLHGKRMQDLPIDPSEHITPEMRPRLVEYCLNDLDSTILLLDDLKGEIDLRTDMGKEYGVDLRSKSDAQIAEAVIKQALEKIKGDRISRPDFPYDYTFKYIPPKFLSFRTPQMQEAFEAVKDARFAIGNGGSVQMPKALESLKIKIGKGIYRMGIGGLHSSEKTAAHETDDDCVLVDSDVASYYPNIVMECGLYPEHLGEDFLKVYKRIVQRRLAAKKAGDKVTDLSLKICINGAFGKFGNQWSILYSPNLLIQVTVTGQLALLMLIEYFELAGIPVVSANTDGVVCKCPRDKYDTMKAIIQGWEFDTGFTMESTEYRGLYSRDVNNYIAIKTDGKAKQKGVYAFVGSKGKAIEKNPTNYVCIDAVTAYLSEGTPIEKTIRECKDIRRFVTIRSVKGGGIYDGEYLGKAVRWYYSTDSRGTITYRTSGNKVPRTEGCKPCMNLPDELPSDIDYNWYIKEAYSHLADIGVL